MSRIWMLLLRFVGRCESALGASDTDIALRSPRALYNAPKEIRGPAISE